MNLFDAFVAADRVDEFHSFRVQVAETAGVDDLQLAADAGDVRKRFAVDGKVFRFVSAEVQMIVAEAAAAPLAAGASEQDDLPGVFICND